MARSTSVNEKKLAALDKKIEKLKEKAVQKHKEYNEITTELQRLLDEISGAKH